MNSEFFEIRQGWKHFNKKFRVISVSPTEKKVNKIEKEIYSKIKRKLTRLRIIKIKSFEKKKYIFWCEID